jgi:hypothetical protein
MDPLRRHQRRYRVVSTFTRFAFCFATVLACCNAYSRNVLGTALYLISLIVLGVLLAKVQETEWAYTLRAWAVSRIFRDHFELEMDRAFTQAKNATNAL